MSAIKQEAGQHPYKCLRCGAEYLEYFDPEAPLVERTCAKCRSNSVRRLKKAAKADGKKK